MSTNKFVSIILPCYNEAGHFEKSLRLLAEESKNFNFPFEFIFVEDKSTDTTHDLLKRSETEFKNAQFVYHHENQGRGAAVKSGFAVAKGNVIGFIDIDLEISPRYIPQFVESLNNYDVAIGNRKYYSDSVTRSLVRDTLSNWYRVINKRILKHSYKDTEAGYKFFRREAMLDFFKSPSNNHWFWDTEFIMFCIHNKLKVVEIDVDFLRDHTKKSTVKIFTDSFYYFKELIRYKNRLKK